MKDGIINEGKSETNLLKKNLSSAQVTDPRTTRTMSYARSYHIVQIICIIRYDAYDLNYMI